MRTIDTPVTDPVTFGVLGCADIAWRRTIPALLAEPRIRLVAVASRTAERAGRFADRFGCAAVTGYQELLERPDIEAIYLPLPEMLHARWIEFALAAGKHVFAEKPMTTDARSTADLLRLADKADLVLLENYPFLHHPQHAEVRRLLDDGVLGELRGMSATFTIPPKPDTDIRYRPDLSGGAFRDIGVYPIGAALHFLGPDLETAGAVLRQRNRDITLGGSVLLHTPAGVTAQATFGMEHTYRAEYELFGSVGSLRLDRAYTPPETWQPVIRVRRQDHDEEFTLPAAHQFAYSVRYFARAVRGEVDTEPYRAFTMRLARLLDDIYERAHRIPC
ncbi:Gfo/Idh/MocA family protein [Nocardia arthritidis]|uniref:Gfo/Idh/MocA family oxidoreductase n=1 Tax=Nocardia arthritidis TaxID=228602 RepID=A0A6G9YA56_9NOCA|nr:Gfo/Idh/MocA family oxidoreductase [Nocardia arthritidis]QIS10092.1 gfo/Idh/MocA family oxidoreductase [Nocardia arthritidis]